MAPDRIHRIGSVIQNRGANKVSVRFESFNDAAATGFVAQTKVSRQFLAGITDFDSRGQLLI